MNVTPFLVGLPKWYTKMFNVITWNTPYSDVKKVNASCIILHLFVIIFSIIVDFEFLYSNYTPFFKVVNDTPFFQIFIDEILCYVVFFIGNLFSWEIRWYNFLLIMSTIVMIILVKHNYKRIFYQRISSIALIFH